MRTAYPNKPSSIPDGDDSLTDPEPKVRFHWDRGFGGPIKIVRYQNLQKSDRIASQTRIHRGWGGKKWQVLRENNITSF